MSTQRQANDRGQANFGWLDSRHSFSFGHYYDPRYMGVSALRVINEDRVSPGAGFATHGHKNMEILSYVLSGTIKHKDSMGHVEHIPAGDFQMMSAGTGITHSEYNASKEVPLHFLQIWLLPNQLQISPTYQQTSFADQAGLTAVVHPTAAGALRAHTDARVYRFQGESDVLLNSDGSRFYVHVVKGSISIDEQTLTEGDGLTVNQATLNIHADNNSEALIFDLP